MKLLLFPLSFLLSLVYFLVKQMFISCFSMQSTTVGKIENTHLIQRYESFRKENPGLSALRQTLKGLDEALNTVQSSIYPDVMIIL